MNKKEENFKGITELSKKFRKLLKKQEENNENY